MKAIEYFPLVQNNRAYLIELFEDRIIATDIVANTNAIHDHPSNFSRDEVLAIVPEVADGATAKHIRAIEEANIAGMEAALAAREAA